MKFRRADWDVSMPEPLIAYWTAWNETDNRLRYRWDMVRKGRTLMEGLDVVTIDPESGLIERVDGFFGHPTPVKDTGTGVPASLLGLVDNIGVRHHTTSTSVG